MTSSTGTDPRAAGLVARERLERHGVSTLSDPELLGILAGPNGGRTADAALDDHVTRIDGVTPRTAAIITAAVELGRRTPGRLGVPTGPGRRAGREGTPRTTPPSRPS